MLQLLERTSGSALESTDRAIKTRLESLTAHDEDYWSFKGRAIREHMHAYVQYPAMMVPQMQGKIMRVIKDCCPNTRLVLDPYVGSGTVMTEAMVLGMDFVGSDINPLSLLICKVKEGPFRPTAIARKAEELLERVDLDTAEAIDVEFRGRDKWFRSGVQAVLCRIRRAIRREPAVWCRRFFWLTLAETVRLTSNSRTSTYKLHIRGNGDIDREICPLSTFRSLLNGNIQKLREATKLLGERGLTADGSYSGLISTGLHDATEPVGNGYENVDLLVTSPPYGDNVTTVPYGQYSYLQLNWIDLADIDPAIDSTLLRSTHEIDSRSLGGSRIRAVDDTRHLRDISRSFAEAMDSLASEPRDRTLRVAAFCRDLNRSLEPILEQLKPNAYMIWTVGNRRVANRPIPTDRILRELLVANGAVLIHEFQREIPTKRMAVKNSVACTMRGETIIVMRKAST